MYASHHDYQHLLEGMTDREAVEYLLEIIQSTANDRKKLAARFVDAAAAKGVEISGMSAIVLALLYENSGRTVVYEVIFDRLELMTGRRDFDRSAVATHMKRIREALRGLDWPVEVRNVRCLGYRVEVHDGWAVA